jgi:hypothetical protein
VRCRPCRPWVSSGAPACRGDPCGRPSVPLRLATGVIVGHPPVGATLAVALGCHCGRPWVPLWSAMGVLGAPACRGDPCGRPCGAIGRPRVSSGAPACRGGPAGRPCSASVVALGCHGGTRLLGATVVVGHGCHRGHPPVGATLAVGHGCRSVGTWSSSGAPREGCPYSATEAPCVAVCQNRTNPAK